MNKGMHKGHPSIFEEIFMKKYDYLIVGSGLFGAIFAYEMTQIGKKCLVIDKRNHIAGNIYCENVEGINVHKYGAHIFHTSDKGVWDYMNQFAEFNNYVNSPVAIYKDELYNMPFNMNTFSKMWNIKTPKEAKNIIDKQIEELNITEPKNLEEQALSLVGRDVYEKLVKGYTEKQWGRDCKDLPAFIIKRLPLRFVYDNNYFNDRYQGIPIGGYTKIIEKMLEGSDVLLNTDYFEFKKENKDIAYRTVYTGMLDQYFDYQYGVLEYRSVYFETEKLDLDNYQGNAVVNYTEREVPYTRIIEHKHFEFGKQPVTVISKEYPIEWKLGIEPYYPVNNEKNEEIAEKYRELARNEENVIFGGRLGEYRYYDMDKVVLVALESVQNEKKRGKI
jgi:UDP-galactopyranose mutase